MTQLLAAHKRRMSFEGTPGDFAESSRRRRPSIGDSGRDATRRGMPSPVRGPRSHANRQTLVVDTGADRFQERSDQRRRSVAGLTAMSPG